MMYNMSYRAFEVGTADFRDQVSAPKLRQLLTDHPLVSVGRYKDQPAAYVVDPATFADLAGAQDRLEELREMLPLLLAALASGAAVPSTTLRHLGIELPDDSWQTLNSLQSQLPMRFSAGENGEAIARGELASAGVVGDLDEDLVLIDD